MKNLVFTVFQNGYWHVVTNYERTGHQNPGRFPNPNYLGLHMALIGVISPKKHHLTLLDWLKKFKNKNGLYRAGFLVSYKNIAGRNQIAIAFDDEQHLCDISESNLILLNDDYSPMLLDGEINRATQSKKEIKVISQVCQILKN